MDLGELIKITNGKLINKYKNVKVRDIKTDTRKLNKNDIFIALKGKKYDGHKYINNKLKASVIISEKYLDNINIPIIKVDSTYECLYKLGCYFRKLYKIPLIALTGSNGKTTLKELITSILSVKYKVLKNEGNHNNLIGVSETLFKLNNSYDIAVIELGMNHLKEIDKLSLMTRPNTAIITNIGCSHIGNLGSKRKIFNAKCEIKSGLIGNLIVNGDDHYLKRLKAYKCGLNYNNDLIAYNICVYEKYLTFNIYIDKEYQVVFNIPAKEYIITILEAIKIGLDYEIDIEDILECIQNFKVIDKRLNVIKNKNYNIIDDSYNASYESVKCGLNYLNKITGNKIIILGDMLELGKYSKKYHKKINYLLDKIDNKEVLTVGNFTKYINSKHFNSNKELTNYLKTIKLDNKYIYIKASHSMNFSEIVDFLK